MKAAVALIALLAATSSVQATLYDASADFSAVNNPNGVWSYGTIGDANAAVRIFQAYNDVSIYSGIDYWYGAEGQVSHNGTSNPITSNTVTWPASTLSIVNTAASHASAVRFTAPIAGTYDISGSFFVLSSIGLSDVGIAANYDTLFTLDNRAISLFGVSSLTGTASFSTSVFLRQSDIVDFAVGGPFLNERDYTGLEALVSLKDSTIPVPGTLVLLGGGVVLVLKRRKRGVSR